MKKHQPKYPGLIKGRVTQMRYLTLEGQHFITIRGNLLNCGPQDKAHIRLIAKLLDKIEAFGDLKEEGHYEYNETKGDCLALEDAEYKFIQGINDGAKYQSRFARDVIKYLDWFDNASTKPPLKVTPDAPATAEKAAG